MAESLSLLSPRSDSHFYSRLGRMNPKRTWSKMLWKSFEARAHELIWTATNSRPQIKIPYPWLRAYREHGHDNFGTKFLLSQNWGHVFTPKFGKRVTGTQKLPGSYHQGIRWIRNSWFRCKNLGIGFLRTASVDDDGGYTRLQDENVLDSTKRERLESKLS